MAPSTTPANAPGRAVPRPGRGIEGDRLESWNQIAAYLNRTVRTLHRWEKEEGLPVHRHQHKKLGTVYAYRSEIESWLTSRRMRNCARPPPRLLLAVLPFRNLSGGVRRERFSDGLTEEVITELGRGSPEPLGVMAPSSIVQYKGTRKSALVIGGELGATYVLEGSVRAQRQRLRISTQLIRVRDQTCIWTGTFDSDGRDILKIQRDVARAIEQAVQTKLSGKPGQIVRSQGESRKISDAHLKGRYFWGFRSRSGIERAIHFLNQAVAADPGNALAHADLAGALSMASYYAVISRRDSFSAANRFAQRALELDGGLVEAHAVSAILREKDYDWAGAEKRFPPAVDSDYACAHHWYGLFLERMGCLRDAQAAMQMALRLDPTSPIICKNSADPYYFSGEYDRAIRRYNETLELDPGFVPARLFLGFSYEQKGLLAEAIAQFRNLASADELNALAALSHAYARSGRPSASRRVLDRLKSSGAYVDPYHFAVTHVALGDHDTAFDYLAAALRQRSEWLLYLRIDPRIQPLRRDPRYKELISRMNLTGNLRR